MGITIWSCANVLAATGLVLAPIVLVDDIVALLAKRNIVALGGAVSEDGTHQWLYV